jgi:hypothetical protein
VHQAVNDDPAIFGQQAPRQYFDQTTSNTSTVCLQQPDHLKHYQTNPHVLQTIQKLAIFDVSSIIDKRLGLRVARTRRFTEDTNNLCCTSAVIGNRENMRNPSRETLKLFHHTVKRSPTCKLDTQRCYNVLISPNNLIVVITL